LKDWNKRKVDLPHWRVELQVLMEFELINEQKGISGSKAINELLKQYIQKEKDIEQKDIDISGLIG